MSESELDGDDVRSQIIQAGLSAIPYVGSPLASLYFGIKNERRFKRLESFYRELYEDLQQVNGAVEELKSATPDESAALITEQINSHVEGEPSVLKRRYYRTFFRRNISNPLLLGYEERKLLLDSLSQLSVLDISLLEFLASQKEPILVRNIRRGRADQYEILGSVNRLKHFGYVATYTQSMAIGGSMDNSLNEAAVATEYGGRFIQYAVESGR